MVVIIFAVCILFQISVSTYSVSDAASLSPSELTKILCRYKTVGECLSTEFIINNLELDKSDKKRKSRRQSLKIKAIKPGFRSKKKNKSKVLKALKGIIKEDMIQKGRYNHKKVTLKKVNKQDLDSISASDVFYRVMENRNLNRIKKRSIPIQYTVDPETLEDFKTISDLNSKTNRSRSVRSTKLKDNIFYKGIYEDDKKRDIILEAVSKLIENEKIRQQLDVVDPSNSKHSKGQQLLWDKLRIKAAEELLLHPKPLPERVTERVYNNLKMDWEYATPGPVEETKLFDDFKSKVEKQYYLDLIERGQRRVLISTLKPYEVMS